MASLVLVPGAWHGAWCWDKVVPLLEAEGHSVTAVDLPGHGANHADVSGMTLGAYAGEVARAVEAAGDGVVLAGHSMGGMVITQAADRAISISKQREMLAARPCERVVSIDTDHSPFLSRPDELATHLLAV